VKITLLSDIVSATQGLLLERVMRFAQTKPPRHSRWTIGALIILITLQTTSSVWAWGRLGHRVISQFAEKQLTPKAKAAIAELLEPGESLADASTWADENRGRLPKTAPRHYVDVPLDEPRYDARFSGEVSTKGCVVDKINEFRLTLRDPNKPAADRRFALRFLVHCVEDMHQPCHVGDNGDKGGNRTQVRFFDRGTNMHALWDSGMIERVSKREDFWLEDLAALDSPEARQEAMKGTVEDWATESLLAAREAYQVPETGVRLKSGEKLGNDYLKANLPAVRRRLYQGGVRLATVLNVAFPE
jgi:nuclease S1